MPAMAWVGPFKATENAALLVLLEELEELLLDEPPQDEIRISGIAKVIAVALFNQSFLEFIFMPVSVV
jgi:hypothetical protein